MRIYSIMPIINSSNSFGEPSCPSIFCSIRRLMAEMFCFEQCIRLLISRVLKLSLTSMHRSYSSGLNVCRLFTVE